MSYFVSITDFMRTTNLIFEAVWTPTLTSDTCITIAIAVTLIYTALFFFSLFYWGGGGGVGGGGVLSFFSSFRVNIISILISKTRKKIKN